MEGVVDKTIDTVNSISPSSSNIYLLFNQLLHTLAWSSLQTRLGSDLENGTKPYKVAKICSFLAWTRNLV